MRKIGKGSVNTGWMPQNGSNRNRKNPELNISKCDAKNLCALGHRQPASIKKCERKSIQPANELTFFRFFVFASSSWFPWFPRRLTMRVTFRPPFLLVGFPLPETIYPTGRLAYSVRYHHRITIQQSNTQTRARARKDTSTSA